MIQANELRIGNYGKLIAINQVVKILSISAIGDSGRGLFTWEEDSQEYEDSLTGLDPIPLTPEILEKAGLDKTCENEYRKGRLTFQFAKYQDRFIMSVFLDGSLMCILKYLHQLQNLYFALTGEELQINL